MRAFYVFMALAVGTVSWANMTLAQGGPAHTGSVLEQLSNESEQVCKIAMGSLAHVTLNQSPAAVLDDRLKPEFQEWLKDQQADGMSGGRGAGGGGGSGRRGPGRDGNRDGSLPGGQGGGPFGGRGGPGGFGGPGGGLTGRLQDFLRRRAEDLKATDPDRRAELLGLADRLERNRGGFQGDFSVLLLDEQGHALILAGLLREAYREPFKGVMLPDGSETTAKFIGANLAAGYTVVQLDKTGGLKPIRLAEAPRQGALLLSMSAGQGTMAWIVAAARDGSKDRFGVPAPEDRGGAFLLNSQGQLAGIVGGTGSFAPDRMAMTAARLKHDVDYITSNNKDIERLRFGFATELLSDKQTEDLSGILHERSAVLVNGVFPGSLAEKAGLKKDDVLISIDNRPITDLPQVQVDLATRTGNVAMEVIRTVEGKPQEVTLQMPLK